MGIPEEAGQAVGRSLSIFQRAPMLFALVLLNAMTLGMVGYLVNTAIEVRARERQEFFELLKACQESRRQILIEPWPI